MMNLEQFKSILTGKINPEISGSASYRLSSVMVVIYGKNPSVIMIEKPQTMKFHAGEIAFPGGKIDPEDSDLLATAIRETSEEIGLKISSENVIGQLEPVVTLNSRFMILPFVCILDDIPKLVANSEVENILHIELEKLLETIKDDDDPEHNRIDEMFTFEFEDHIIWGASARILKQIHSRVKP